MTTSPTTGQWVWSHGCLGYGDTWSPGPIVEIHTWEQRQPIEGFGGAFTDASAQLFSQLNSWAQADLIEKYFGDSGLSYNMGRVHINSCDFSVNSYSFDDVDNDWNLDHFDWSLARDGKLISLIWAAQSKLNARGAHLKLLATPWSPPWWMKTNRNMMGSPWAPGLRPECQAVWAKYIGNWIAAMKQKGIPIWAMTPQNEPLANNPFEANMLLAGQESEFIAWHLGPTLKILHPEVLILAFDHNKAGLSQYAKDTYYGANGQAQQYIQGFAFHWYDGDNFANVQWTKNQFPNLMLLATEATYEKSHFANGWSPTFDWNHGLGYAHDIIGDIQAGASGWIDWNLILDPSGGPNHVGNVCDAAIIADISQQKLYVHAQYFYLGHFSKFFWPGSHSLTTIVEGSWVNWQWRGYGICDGRDGLEATSVKRPTGDVVLVVLNCGSIWMDFRIRIDNGQRTMAARVPPQGIQTYILPVR